MNAWKKITAALCKPWDCWRAVLLNRSFYHLSLTYGWLWMNTFISKVASAFLFQIFWLKLSGLSRSGCSRGAYVAARSYGVARKTHCKLYFGVWSWLESSLPHVEIGLDARGFLYFEASARRSAHALSFTIKLFQLALLRKCGYLLLAGQTSMSCHLSLMLS